MTLSSSIDAPLFGELSKEQKKALHERAVDSLSGRKRFNARRAYGQGEPQGFIGTASESGGTDDDKHKRLMKKWYGLTSMAHDWTYPCPYRLLGQHEPETDESGELKTYDAEWDDQDQLCHCDSIRTLQHTPGFELVWDHVRGWYDSLGRPVITLEPYGFPRIEEVESYVAPLERVRVGFEGRSPYGASYVLFLIGPESMEYPTTSLRR